MNAIIALLIRQGLAACGGFFAANNITGDSTTSILIGCFMWFIPTVWSWIAKAIHLEDTSRTGWLANSEIFRVFIGAAVSQGITAASAYFATSADNPELFIIAIVNAIASKFGAQQKLAFIGSKDALKILLLSLSSSLLVFGSSCSQFKGFMERNQVTLESILIDEVRRVVPSAKQPRNIQPIRSADDADSETILEGPEPTAPVCEEPRGEALPACLKITPRITVPRYGVQVAASLR